MITTFTDSERHRQDPSTDALQTAAWPHDGQENPRIGQEPKHCLADTNRDGRSVLRDAATRASPIRKSKNHREATVKNHLREKIGSLLSRLKVGRERLQHVKIGIGNDAYCSYADPHVKSANVTNTFNGHLLAHHVHARDGRSRRTEEQARADALALRRRGRGSEAQETGKRSRDRCERKATHRMHASFHPNRVRPGRATAGCRRTSRVRKEAAALGGVRCVLRETELPRH